MNVLAGERYKMNPKESQALMAGEYGRLPAPVNEEVRKKVIGDRKVITYGLSLQADVRAQNIRAEEGGNRFDVVVRQCGADDRVIDSVFVSMPGRHNVQNALAAIAVAQELNCPDAVVRTGFAQFGGVRRRFTRVGEVAGAAIIDDYAHHPVEIRAVLSAAREAAAGRVVAVVQPHRFTRLRDLMDDFQTAFNDADQVVVTPVYAAGEEPLPGVDAAALAAGLKNNGHRAVGVVGDLPELAALLGPQLERGDMVVCLGAGDITRWAAMLGEAIADAQGTSRAA